MKVDSLFQERLRRAQKINFRYLRLLFNDHFILFLMIALGAGILGYRNLLTAHQSVTYWHSIWWQAISILWLLVGLQFGSLVTYFKPADRLYLFANDRDIIKSYLASAMRLSICYASVWQIIFIAVIAPILWRMDVDNWSRLFFLIIFVISYKMLLLMYERDKLFLKSRRLTIAIFEPDAIAEKILFRFLVPGTLLAFIIGLSTDQSNVMVIIWLLLAGMVVRYFAVTEVKSELFAIDWLRATAQAQIQQQRTLHFFALFAEVPHQPKTIKRRRYLDFLLKRLIKGQSSMFRLYLIRLARDTEILPLIVRLLLVGVVLIIALKSAPLWLITTIAAAILYLMTFQMLPLYDDTHQNLWTRLMPVSKTERLKSFASVQIIVAVPVILILVMIVIFIRPLKEMAVILATMLLVEFIMFKFYIPKNSHKIKK
ncbi:ABC transporter permease [Leuconostoc pseudomesenteroides]|jgi:ABC-2 type transport system permease protein|uniref:ABC transporter permease n=1 Tax=Leuconostoc falkenbergense TaxID=2766470 RepID=A0ABT7RX80_9LACO|nr:ABC transporter permease [Leuconostoc falkenbergense]RDG20301.1 ABC transporter permease [Leuconostoc pseudomesenteroides]MCT4411277.1 ABC transporter permease [Leuconostoc falkenbergense]MDM7645824.1 ABC transporter permease [Leuconostoc falkenbergense]MDV3545183.1 ABC transporter permease [Leuconostoc falkenbergense]QSB50941.1 ABC transporter permease [Leuconostoc falkenbergense]